LDQRGGVVGQAAARLSATLFAFQSGGRQAYITSWTRRQLPAGTYPVAIHLPAYWRQKLKLQHHLSLLLKFTIVTPTGRQSSYARRVTLTS
jgi:hypothetical protein